MPGDSANSNDDLPTDRSDKEKEEESDDSKDEPISDKNGLPQRCGFTYEGTYSGSSDCRGLHGLRFRWDLSGPYIRGGRSYPMEHYPAKWL